MEANDAWWTKQLVKDTILVKNATFCLVFLIQLQEALTEGAAAATAGMELNDFLALDPHTREFLRKTLNEDAKALMAELGNDPKAKGMLLQF